MFIYYSDILFVFIVFFIFCYCADLFKRIHPMSQFSPIYRSIGSNSSSALAVPSVSSSIALGMFAKVMAIFERPLCDNVSIANYPTRDPHKILVLRLATSFKSRGS